MFLSLILLISLFINPQNFSKSEYKTFDSWERLEKSIDAERLELVLICSPNCPHCPVYEFLLKNLIKEHKYLDVFYIDSKHVDNQYYNKGDLVPIIIIFVSGVEYKYKLGINPIDKNYIDLDDLPEVINNIAIFRKFK